MKLCKCLKQKSASAPFLIVFVKRTYAKYPTILIIDPTINPIDINNVITSKCFVVLVYFLRDISTIERIKSTMLTPSETAIPTNKSKSSRLRQKVFSPKEN